MSKSIENPEITLEGMWVILCSVILFCVGLFSNWQIILYNFGVLKLKNNSFHCDFRILDIESELILT